MDEQKMMKKIEKLIQQINQLREDMVKGFCNKQKITNNITMNIDNNTVAMHEESQSAITDLQEMAIESTYDELLADLDI